MSVRMILCNVAKISHLPKIYGYSRFLPVGKYCIQCITLRRNFSRVVTYMVSKNTAYSNANCNLTFSPIFGSGKLPGLNASKHGRVFSLKQGSCKLQHITVTSSHNFLFLRAYSSSPSDGSGKKVDGAASSGGDGEESDDGSDSETEASGEKITAFQQSISALSPLTVPEEWPQVPVIAVKRHPVFPHFIKMIEV